MKIGIPATALPSAGASDEKALALILLKGSQGILQSDLWKTLGLTSRDASRIARRLERKKKIRRTRLLSAGKWTYRLVGLKSIIGLLDFKMPVDEVDQEVKQEPDSETSRAWRWGQGSIGKGRLALDKALEQLDLILKGLNLGTESHRVESE